MKYLVDSTAFIEPFQKYYPFSLVPQYWQVIALGHDDDCVHSIDHVHRELKGQKDDLSDWADRMPPGFFLDSSSHEAQTKYSEVIQWVMEQDFNDKPKDDFAAGADGWLVAYAQINELTIVTQEALKSSDTKRHVSIPNVCRQFGVDCINVFEFFRRLSAMFDPSDYES